MQKMKSFLWEMVMLSSSYVLLNWLFYDRFDSQLFVEAIFVGSIGALLSITLFPRIFKAIMTPIAAKLERSIPPPILEENEKVLRNEGANHLKGIERVGGKLTLTSRRLLFRSHKFNLQPHTECIHISDVQSVEKDKTGSGNVVRVNLKAGQKHFFGVVSPDSWLETLSAQIPVRSEEDDARHSG